MYAIVFDLDTATLEQTYPNSSWRNAYADVRRVLEIKGFDWQQGSTYFGNEAVTAVDCVLAVQELKRQFDWFQPSVRDIRMLRIEENNDLGPALG
ncbi:virulence-associated protein VapD [Sphingopyxis panaciterrae]|uniref:virulence factor n=1 Tax=Sphingopyxis panaciterrae TaxID=363841 RepID=UPI0014246D93|nr:virulence factor [Sphingopyxis panaciterrae]NIJ39033.1 virulence-associated protein VapD [Sphingopyxis panaciterrae]